MSDCKPSPTPFQLGVKLIVECDSPIVDATLYCRLVGSLIYLMHSVPNVSYVVSMISTFMQKPHESHWKESKRILKYLQGTLNYGVFYSNTALVSLLGYIDFDWARDITDRRSIARYVFHLGLGLVS